MAKENKKLKLKKKPLSFDMFDSVIEKLHTQKLLLYAMLAMATIIFAISLLGYVDNKPFLIFRNVFNISKAFTISTILLLSINYVVSKITATMEMENFVKLKKYSLIGLLLMFSFSVSQLVGCYQLHEQKIHFLSFYSRIYIYTIYAVHFIGMVFGTITLVHYFLLSIKLVKDPVKRLIVTTNPFQKVRLEMLGIFWNYFTYSWILLFLYFYFTII